MLDRAQTRALPLLNKGAGFTPALNACCGVCRTCMTTNVVTLALAALSGAARPIVRLVGRKT